MSAQEKKNPPDKRELAEDRTDWAHFRTRLASERSFSAWVRTGLTALVAGLGISRFLHELGRPGYTRTLGMLLVLAGGAFFVIGFLGYRRAHGMLAGGKEKVPPLWLIALLSALLLAGTLIAALLVFE